MGATRWNLEDRGPHGIDRCSNQEREGEGALDIGLPRYPAGDSLIVDPTPEDLARIDAYLHIPTIREEVEDKRTLETEFLFWPHIRRCVAFDVGFSEMRELAAFRFLYERLFGPKIRPWITSL